MKEGLLERIRSKAHWRVNLRPLVEIDPISLVTALENVDRARVSFRGWDFPHVDKRNDEEGGTEYANEYVENWCDWWVRHEFWRMYKSGQFIHLSNLEDLNMPQADELAGKALHVLDTIYSIAEFVEFGFRLARNGLYRNGFDLILSISGIKNRFLYHGEGRVPFTSQKRTSAEKIEAKRKVTPAVIEQGSGKVPTDVIIEVFDRFGWLPSPNK